MAKVRVTQAFLDVVTQDDSDLRVSQALLEVVGQAPSELRVSQAMLEVVGYILGPLIPTVTVSDITATTALFTSSAYDQGPSGSATHSASRWTAINLNTGEVVYDSGETATDLLTHTAATLPSYTDLVAGCMHKNGSGEWSYYPGQPSASFQTLVAAAEAGVALKFYDASWTLLSTHVSTGTTDTSYGDWVRDEDILVPASTRYIVPCVYKIGSGLNDIRVKEFQVDKGRLSGGYAPTSFKPEIHDETDIPGALSDEGQVTETTFDIDWSEGIVQTVELATNATMTWSNLEAGKRYGLVVEQDSTGSRLLTWPGAAKHPGGSPPTLTTTGGSKDVFVIIAISASEAHVHTAALDSK
jgi:hypothetical protein